MEWTFSLSQLEKEKELIEENIKDQDSKEDAKNWFKEKLNGTII